LFVANIDGEEYVDISFKKLQLWRDLEDRIMPLTSMFQVLLDLLETLEKVDQRFAARSRTDELNMSSDSSASKGKTDFFRSRKGAVKALMASASGLQKRIHGVLGLLANTLEMRNHKQLAETNKLLVNLQIENIEDNATVQIVTVVTLMYLPASFVATLFGMNLFGFNQETARIRIAKDFWIYVALMVPLTFVTVSWWWIRTRNAKAERERKRNPSAQQIAQNLASANLFQMQHMGHGIKSRVATWV
jgi:Mg2+ and Co2+ transporter CorA